MTFRRSGAFASTMLALCVSGHAAAQEAVVRGEEEASRVEEIVVTAQKREQALRDVPIAISAFSGEFLAEQGVSKFDELSALTPGFLVQEQSANNTGFVVRGITSDSGEANIEPRVAVFFDGVSASRNRGSYIELFDIERVEVVKGPQATLFGRSALIGGVSVITNKADLEDFSIRGEFEYGNNGQIRYEAAANAVLIPGRLAVRAAGTHRERDGFNANVAGGPDLGGVNVDAVRVAIAFQPIETLRFDFNIGTHGDNNTGTSFKSGTFATPGGDASPFTAAALNTFTGPGAPPFAGGRGLGLDRRVNYLTLQGQWEITPSLSLSSISGYRDFDAFEVFDADGSFLPLFLFAEDAKGLQYSQELRLNFDTGGRVSGFIGASYFREDGRQRVPLQFDERATLALFAGQFGGPLQSPALAATLGPVSQSTLPIFLSPQTQALILDGALQPLLATAPLLGVPTAGVNLAAIANNLRPAFQEESTNFGETDAFDIYADVTIEITPKLEVSAGLRYTTEDKTAGLATFQPNGRSVLGAVLGALGLAGTVSPTAPLAQQQAIIGQSIGLLQLASAPGAAAIPTSAAFPLPNFGIAAQPTAAAFRSETFSGFTWRAVAKYQPYEDFTVFASYARGRRPEVIDPAFPAAPGAPIEFSVLSEETVDSFEVGFKARALDGQLSVDGNAFYYMYDDFVTTEVVAGDIISINAGEAKSVGVELASRWAPIERFQVFANYGYNRARFQTGARDGNVFRLSPDHKLAVGADAFYPAPGGEFFLRPTWIWQSTVFFDDDNDEPELQSTRLSPAFSDFSVNEFQDGYGVLNIRGGYRSQRHGWALEGFVENALDAEFIIDAGNVGDSFGIPTLIRGPGRLFGLRVSANY